MAIGAGLQRIEVESFGKLWIAYWRTPFPPSENAPFIGAFSFGELGVDENPPWVRLSEHEHLGYNASKIFEATLATLGSVFSSNCFNRITTTLSARTKWPG